MEKKITPRGIRNNNPLNIRKGSNWKGERSVQTDNAFEEFESMTYGLRAGFIILKKYMSGYHGMTRKFNTIELIVKRWAPPSENATQKYIDYVSKKSEIPPRRALTFDNKGAMCKIVAAMVEVECGQSIDPSLIESAYEMV